MMVDSYKPYVSGITNYVDINKRYLELAGHEVFVFTFGDEENQESEPRVIYSKGVPLADSGFYLSLRYSQTAKKLLQSMDVVHVHHPFLSGRLALRYCRPVQIPIVFTNHTRYDLYAQAYLPMMPEEFSQGLLQAYMPSFCEAVDLVIAPSPGMERILRQFNVGGHVAVIPNGVELKNFHEAKSFPRAELGFKAEDILLVYAGRLAPEKNLPFLLESFSGVAQTIPNTYLLLMGSGIRQFEDELRTLVSELGLAGRVRFMGRIAYDQLPAYLAMSDIFVTASITEVHPLSVIEALGTGLPVMGIHSVGVGDTVQDGVTGLLATHDLAAFTAKLTHLCLDTNLRAQMRESARKASSAYNITNTTNLVLEQYEALKRRYKPRKDDWSVQLQKLLEKIQLTQNILPQDGKVSKSISSKPVIRSTHNCKIGGWGEGVAADWLTERGCKIVARNVRTPYGEIDIVARQDDVTLFVEVKTRTSNRMGLPEISVTPRKQKHMLAAAEHYAAEHEIDHWQIDVISIEGKPGAGAKPAVTHFENVV